MTEVRSRVSRVKPEDALRERTAGACQYLAAFIGSTQSLVDAKKQQQLPCDQAWIPWSRVVIAFGVTNLGVVFVPYPPNSEESPFINIYRPSPRGLQGLT